MAKNTWVMMIPWYKVSSFVRLTPPPVLGLFFLPPKGSFFLGRFPLESRVFLVVSGYVLDAAAFSVAVAVCPSPSGPGF